MKSLFDKDYYKHCCGEDYSKTEHWEAFFGYIATNIINKFNPKSVLDVGCAFGYLVKALRDKGVESYGIDISEYAISMAKEGIKPYLAVQSALDDLPTSFPKKFDLVVSIEVIEHLYEEDGLHFIKKICGYSDTILISSSPYDTTEATHFNVQQPEYWAKNFAKYEFYNCINFAPTYITEWAFCFKKAASFINVVEDYERHKRITERSYTKILTEKDNSINELRQSLLKLENENNYLQSENEVLATKNMELISCNKELIAEKLRIISDKDNELEALHALIKQREYQINECEGIITTITAERRSYMDSYNIISNSFFWKITKPFRVVLDILKKNRYFSLFDKGIHSIKNHGIKQTYFKVRRKVSTKYRINEYYKTHILTEEQRKQQLNTRFSKDIKFSIVVPLYNTPKNFLIEMIESVLKQTYTNWELCMADGSDSSFKYVTDICNNYAKKDSRIKYKKLEKNLGISENTNACIEMSSGEYIALFDHDDLLHPTALYEYMRVICDKCADFIYCDEASFSEDVNKLHNPSFKPDYAIDTLRSYNYICHLSVFSRVLLEKVGRLDSRFDGSQDYDIILRLTEKAEVIEHIPKILYFWRAHQKSVAMTISSKPYTVIKAKEAICEHLQRLGLKGEVGDSSVLSTYKISYEIVGNPLVSIIIPNKDHIPDLHNCIESLKLSSYKNFEVIIVENNSTDKDTFDYYKKIQDDASFKVIYWKEDFNFSAINNYAVGFAKGDLLLFLNNDVEVITESWLEEMIMFAQRKDVGAVGAMLYYPDDTIQHAGVIIKIGGVAGHSHKYYRKHDYGFMSRLTIAQNLSAVTAACLMMRKSVFQEINGFDERFAIAFNDVDLCMRIRKAGYLIVWTPYAELYHHESISRGYEDTSEKQERFASEVRCFQSRWKKELEQGDPYYNVNLTLEREDFSLR